VNGAGSAQIADPAPLVEDAEPEKMMSQRNVEKVIGRLVTDEAFRLEFVSNPERTLDALAERGVELTECERRGLRTMDARMLAFFADAIDPCLQKSDLGGGLK
jgi:hypothetical protein